VIKVARPVHLTITVTKLTLNQKLEDDQFELKSLIASHQKHGLNLKISHIFSRVVDSRFCRGF